MAGVVKQLAGGGGGQSFMDRVTAAKHSISGAGLAKAVCKATTEEIMAPKKKHLHYLIECTNESNVSIPELANELLERLKHPNWVVAFKSLITVHHLMNYGNERFTQYLASNNCNFALIGYQDKSTVQGADMSRFICRYSVYVQEKAIAYRVLGYDFCKVKRGTDDGVLRILPVDKILKALTVLIAQFDALLGFDATANELSNGVINSAFAVLFKDANRLFVVFNDGIINLLSKYFEAMNKKQCREALDIYKKFVTRSERHIEFSKVAEYAGIDRANLTRLEKHPASFLEAMESHLAHMEGRKFGPRSGSSHSLGSATAAPSSSSATASAAAAAAAAAAAPFEPPKMSQVLLEEQQHLERLKAEQMKRKAAAATAAAAPPPAPATVAAQPKPAPQLGQQQQQQQLNDDLLFMSSPAQQPMMMLPRGQPIQQPQQQQQQQPVPFFASFPASNAAPAANFNTFDPFGTVLQPTNAASTSAMAAASNQSAPGGLNSKAFSHSQQQQQQQQQQHPTSSSSSSAASAGVVSGHLTGDLDSSLASLVDSLSVKPGQQYAGGGRHPQQQGVNWGGGGGGGGGSAGSAAAAAGAAGSAATRTAAGSGGGSGGVKISAGPTINWGQQPQYAAQPAPTYAPGAAYSGVGQPMGFLHTQSQPTFRMSPQQQQQQQMQYGWQQPVVNQHNNSNDPFGAL